MPTADIMEATLTARVAGQSVIETLLRSREAAPERSTLARLLGVSPLTAEERRWYSGAVGETITGRMLARLPDTWTVLHAVPIGVGTSDVDHIVIGPGGVFTINTKHHFGQSIWVGARTLLVAGTQQPYLRNSEYEAERATVTLSRILPAHVDVTPVIAFVHPKSLTIKSRPLVVSVLEAHTLVRWLLRRPVVLTPDQSALIALVAADPTTWHSSAGEACDTAALAKRFRELDRQVRGARYVRVAWGGAAAAAAVLGAMFALPSIAEVLSGLVG